jgi:hypothetical protein
MQCTNSVSIRAKMSDGRGNIGGIPRAVRPSHVDTVAPAVPAYETRKKTE